MKISSIGLFSNELEVLNFDLDNPRSDHPYTIKAMTGLDADEITPKFYGFGGGPTRKKLMNFSLKPKEIVMRIGLNPHRQNSESYSSLRDELYKSISSTRTGNIQLRFNSGVLWVAVIDGYITKFEVPYFSKAPEVVITLRCDESTFKAYTPTHILADALLSGVDPLVIVDDTSTAPHGFELEFTVTDTISSLAIVDSVDLGIMSEVESDWFFGVVYPFETGDVVNINSQAKIKSITVKRGSTTYNIANKIAPLSVWPMLFPGMNKIKFVTDPPDPDLITFGFAEYTAEFWGI